MANQGGSHEQHVKAGQQSHKNDQNRDREQQARGREDDKQRGGGGNFANDRERASEAGRKGGKS